MDHTEAKIQRLTLLANASAIMLLREEPSALVNGVVELLRPALQLDLALNFLMEDDGGRLRLNVAHGMPSDRLAELEFVDARQEVDLGSFGMKAHASMPLMAGQRLVGILAVGRRATTRFSADELDLLRSIGAQMAVALDRRRLIRVYRALQERDQRLGALTSALSEAATPTQVARAVIDHATEIFQSVGTVVVRITDDGASLEILDANAMPDKMRREWTRFPKESPVPLADVVRTREAITIESREQWASRYPALAGMLEETRQHSLVVVPLVIEGRAIGSMGIAFSTPRGFTADDMHLATLIAQHCAQALERARLFEAAQLARAAAEAADREKVDLLAAISHDLRTPLNAIGGYVQLLDMEVRGPVTQDQRDDLRRIAGNQRRLLYLVEELLRFASLASAKRPREIRAIPARDALVTAHDSVAPQAASKRLSLEVRADDDALAVSGDPERLQQILVNLLSNAIKFTPPGGAIALSADVDEEKPERVRLRVRDTGPGIPQDMQAKIFEPFSQLPDRPQGSDGVGLGLAISRTLARASGGDVTVQSQPGDGATFSVSLPRA